MNTVKIGDVYRLKTSGENLVVLSVSSGYVKVRRAKLTRDGYDHIEETIGIDELETVADSIQREFDEMVWKQRMMSDYLKSKGEGNELAGVSEQVQ